MMSVWYNRFFVQNNRTGIVVRNIFFSGFLKGFTLIFSFLMVPLCLKAVSQKEYGIILTITSIVSWISFFDVGIGNGLRNKLGKAIAENDLELAKKYVSTAYFYITIIFLGILALYSIAHPFIEWHQILNLRADDVKDLNLSIYIIISLFILRFILQLVSVVMLANQRSYLSDSILPISSFLSIAIIYIFYITGIADFYKIIFTICAVPVFVLLLYSVILYQGQYKWLSPSRKYITHNLRKDLLSLGAKFFLLQLVVMIIFSTSNFLVANLYSMEKVTTFDIASKVYGIPLMLFSIISSPLWGAFTNAWYQDDKNWIRKTIRNMMFINISLLLLSFIIFSFYKPLTALWLGQPHIITSLFAITLIIFNFQIAFNNIYSYFLNGIGKINLQLITAVIGGLINIPLTIFLAKNTDFGLASLCIANIISLLPSSIITSIQTFKFLNNKAKGIWS
jgi:O-antigen/teichoic acid export membrane protein